MTARGYTLFDTSIGRCGIAWSERGVSGFQLPESRDPETRARLLKRLPGYEEATPPPEVQDAIDSIVALLHGEAHTVVMKTRFQNSPQRWGLRLLAVLSLNLAGQSLAFAQEEKLYYFVDEHGVPHLSNTPSDPRYKPYKPAKRGEEPGTSSHVEEPSAPEELHSSPIDALDQGPELPDDEPVPPEELPQNRAR